MIRKKWKWAMACAMAACVAIAGCTAPDDDGPAWQDDTVWNSNGVGELLAKGFGAWQMDGKRAGWGTCGIYESGMVVMADMPCSALLACLFKDQAQQNEAQWSIRADAYCAMSEHIGNSAAQQYHAIKQTDYWFYVTLGGTERRVRVGFDDSGMCLINAEQRTITIRMGLKSIGLDDGDDVEPAVFDTPITMIFTANYQER